jgi:uncharacterized membrane protein YraQ (UPF0718 family)
MNVAILIMFWAMLGWRFAFAEFFGGIIIIAIVSVGLSLVFATARCVRSQPRRPATAAMRS